MGNNIKITKETMLKNSIYRSLIGFKDSTGLTIPCKIRKEIEEYIIYDFKTQLRMNNDNSFLKAEAKIYNLYKMQRIKFETGQIVEFVREDEAYLTIKDNNEEIVLRKIYLSSYEFLNENTEKIEKKELCECCGEPVKTMLKCSLKECVRPFDDDCVCCPYVQ